MAVFLCQIRKIKGRMDEVTMLVTSISSSQFCQLFKIVIPPRFSQLFLLLQKAFEPRTLFVVDVADDDFFQLARQFDRRWGRRRRRRTGKANWSVLRVQVSRLNTVFVGFPEISILKDLFNIKNFCNIWRSSCSFCHLDMRSKYLWAAGKG